MWKTEAKPYHALREAENKKARERRKLRRQPSADIHKNKNAPFKLDSEEGIRAAFYVAWDAASFSSLREYARQIDLLYPEWLHVLTPDGRVQAIDEDTGKFFPVVEGSDRSLRRLQGHALSEGRRHRTWKCSPW